jgi:acyl phosphate:glycerol-3-phosphate acyltransferase
MDPTSSISLLLAGLIGYLLGAIPFGLVFTRMAGLGDIRAVGSGNIGATNVLRTGNKALAAATLACDVAKGAAAVLLAWWAFGLASAGGDTAHDVSTFSPAHAAGLGAFLGHLFPAWLGFKGGKGVATYIGVIGALFWPAALVFCGVWLVAAKLWRYSSLSALIAAIVTPVATLALGQTTTAVLLGMLSILLILKHDNNIRRLIAGTEPRIGASKS